MSWIKLLIHADAPNNCRHFLLLRTLQKFQSYVGVIGKAGGATPAIQVMLCRQTSKVGQVMRRIKTIQRSAGDIKQISGLGVGSANSDCGIRKKLTENSDHGGQNGLITNITACGAFVDIGVHQDGLVHVSQLTNHFVRDPNQVVKLNQKVRVKVMEVDVNRKRISLSMKEALGL